MKENESKRKLSKKIVILVVTIILVVGILAMILYNQRASRYTQEQHLSRVGERIQKTYIDSNLSLRAYGAPNEEMAEGIKATSFDVYPLYDENDRLKYCLVEFYPYGFLFVLIRDERLKGFGWLGASTSMYLLSSVQGEPAWTPCTVNEENGETFWEQDESGEKIRYYHSPFSVRGVQNEKKYLVEYHHNGSTFLIPAIKYENGYINLFSNEVFDKRMTAVSASYSFISKKHFDL